MTTQMTLQPAGKPDILDMLTTAVVVLDDNLQVSQMNSAAESLFGISAARVCGTPVQQLLHDEMVAFEALAQILADGQSLTQRDAHFKTRGGLDITADISMSADPTTGQIIIELQPVNRLARINRDDQSQVSLKMSRELIRGLAHEVKNPLGGLRGAAQLLERELDNPEHREYTQIIISEADRLSDLVDRLLGPDQEPKTDWFNIHQVLERAIKLVDAELPGRITFVRDYDPSLPELSGDELQIMQAVLNIMRNAGQALESVKDQAEPTITLRSRVVRTFTIASVKHRIVAQIDIIDNGPGIAEDMIDRIFFPMISGRSGGTGLGLAITQSIIERHHGVIECESQPGRTCFSIFLPLPSSIDNSSNENSSIENSSTGSSLDDE